MTAAIVEGDRPPESNPPAAGDDVGAAEVPAMVDARAVASRVPSWAMWLRVDTPRWTGLGLAVAAAGFIVIAYSWGRVAAETQVYLQLPYVVSGAFVGLGLVMVAVAILAISSRRRDAVAVERRLDELEAILVELRGVRAERRAVR